jgi:hypothetical protein
MDVSKKKSSRRRRELKAIPKGTSITNKNILC